MDPIQPQENMDGECEDCDCDYDSEASTDTEDFTEDEYLTMSLLSPDPDPVRVAAKAGDKEKLKDLIKVGPPETWHPVTPEFLAQQTAFPPPPYDDYEYDYTQQSCSPPPYEFNFETLEFKWKDPVYAEYQAMYDVDTTSVVIINNEFAQVSPNPIEMKDEEPVQGQNEQMEFSLEKEEEFGWDQTLELKEEESSSNTLTFYAAEGSGPRASFDENQPIDNGTIGPMQTALQNVDYSSVLNVPSPLLIHGAQSSPKVYYSPTPSYDYTNVALCDQYDPLLTSNTMAFSEESLKERSPRFYQNILKSTALMDDIIRQREQDEQIRLACVAETSPLNVDSMLSPIRLESYEDPGTFAKKVDENGNKPNEVLSYASYNCQDAQNENGVSQGTDINVSNGYQIMEQVQNYWGQYWSDADSQMKQEISHQDQIFNNEYESQIPGHENSTRSPNQYMPHIHSEIDYTNGQSASSEYGYGIPGMQHHAEQQFMPYDNEPTKQGFEQNSTVEYPINGIQKSNYEYNYEYQSTDMEKQEIVATSAAYSEGNVHEQQVNNEDGFGETQIQGLPTPLELVQPTTSAEPTNFYYNVHPQSGYETLGSEIEVRNHSLPGNMVEQEALSVRVQKLKVSPRRNKVPKVRTYKWSQYGGLKPTAQ